MTESPPHPAAHGGSGPRRTSLAEDALNLPNLLTMGRIVMIPIFLWLLDHETKVSGKAGVLFA